MDRHFDEASGGEKGFEVEGSPGAFKRVFKQWNKMDCVDDVGCWVEWEKGIFGEEEVVVREEEIPSAREYNLAQLSDAKNADVFFEFDRAVLRAYANRTIRVALVPPRHPAPVIQGRCPGVWGWRCMVRGPLQKPYTTLTGPFEGRIGPYKAL